MEELSKVPDWLGEAFTTAIGWVFLTVWGGLGAFLKWCYDKWKHHRLPFKRDKERYDHIMNTPSVYPALDFFRYNTTPLVDHYVIDGLEDFITKLASIQIPRHVNKKLRTKEQYLSKQLEKMIDFLAYTQPNRNGGGQVLPEQEDKKRNYFQIRDCLIQAFESYRDCGADLFAVKLSKGVANG